MKTWGCSARNGVSTSGREAFHQGWGTRACPHEPVSVAAMLWHSDWWRANAEAFADHIGTPLEPSRDFRAGWVARDFHLGGYSDDEIERAHIRGDWDRFLRKGPHRET